MTVDTYEFMIKPHYDALILMNFICGVCVLVSVFGERELVRLSPPKSSTSKLCDSAPCQLPLPCDPITDGGTTRPVRHTQLLRTTQSDGVANPGSDCFHELHHHESHHLSERLKKLHTSDRGHLVAMETAQPSPSIPLPRLRNVGLKDGRGRKVTWVGPNRTGPPRLLVNGSKPPALPPQRHHTSVMKSLRQERGTRGEQSAAGGGEEMNGGTRNTVQFHSPHRRDADLNLPQLPAALQGKTDRKNQLHSMGY